MSNLLTQNTYLRKYGIHNWTLPAWVTRMPDGRNINVCPAAGACVKLCYARNGAYKFPGVVAAHQRNLNMAMGDPGKFAVAMLDELDKPRFRKARPPHLPDLPRDHLHPDVARLLDDGAPIIRIHDSGDFFSDDYLATWLHIATLRPDVLFYAYTKEVDRVRRVAADAPPNLMFCFSLGGREDHLVDTREGGDRHVDVFPTKDALLEAGYTPQTSHDLLCVVAPSTRVGIVSNNIAAFKKAQGARTFGQIEATMKRGHPNRAGR